MNALLEGVKRNPRRGFLQEAPVFYWIKLIRLIAEIPPQARLQPTQSIYIPIKSGNISKIKGNICPKWGIYCWCSYIYSYHCKYINAIVYKAFLVW